MKIKRSQLKQIIKEELKRVLFEEEEVISPLRGVRQGRLGHLPPEQRAELQRMQQRGFDFETQTWPEQRTPEYIAAREQRLERENRWTEANIADDQKTLAAMEAELAARQRPAITGRRRATPRDIARLGGHGGHDVLPGVVAAPTSTPARRPTELASLHHEHREADSLK